MYPITGYSGEVDWDNEGLCVGCGSVLLFTIIYLFEFFYKAQFFLANKCFKKVTYAGVL